MLTVSHQQMAALAAGKEAGFRQRLFEFLCEEFPDQAEDRAAVVAVVDVGIADARNLGLQGARAIAVYVTVAFLLGMEIKDDPRLVAAVRDSRASEADKIAWLQDWLGAIAGALDGE